MLRPQIHRLAAKAVYLALLAILTGAFVTSQNISSGPPAPPGVHPLAGGATVFLLALILCCVFSSPSCRRLRGLITGTFVLGLATAASFGLPLLHACLAQVFFAAVVCLALRASISPENGTQPFGARRWPAIPRLAGVTLVLVMLQVFLGAAYRHKALSVMPHLGGALLATLAVLGLSAFVLQSLPDHPVLRSAAVTTLTITLIQVTLGMAVFLMMLLDADTTLAAVISVVAHVLSGALMLGASAVLAIQIRRSAAA
jgi:hypothetical protein